MTRTAEFSGRLRRYYKITPMGLKKLKSGRTCFAWSIVPSLARRRLDFPDRMIENIRNLLIASLAALGGGVVELFSNVASGAVTIGAGLALLGVSVALCTFI